MLAAGVLSGTAGLCRKGAWAAHPLTHRFNLDLIPVCLAGAGCAQPDGAGDAKGARGQGKGGGSRGGPRRSDAGAAAQQHCDDRLGAPWHGLTPQVWAVKRRRQPLFAVFVAWPALLCVAALWAHLPFFSSPCRSLSVIVRSLLLVVFRARLCLASVICRSSSINVQRHLLTPV